MINLTIRLKLTQPTSGGAVTAVLTDRCANCVKIPPQQWGPDLPLFGQANHVDPLDGWHCSSQKRCRGKSKSDDHIQTSLDFLYLPQTNTRYEPEIDKVQQD